MATVEEVFYNGAARLAQYVAANGGYVANATFLSKEGATAFFRYDKELRREEADALSDELKTEFSYMPKINPEFIMAAHEVLRQDQSAAEKLPHRLLPFFLVFYSGFAALKRCDRARLSDVLPQAMRAVGMLATQMTQV